VQTMISNQQLVLPLTKVACMAGFAADAAGECSVLDLSFYLRSPANQLRRALSSRTQILVTLKAPILTPKFVKHPSDAKRIPTEFKSKRNAIMNKRTLTKTKSSRNGVALIEGDQDIGFETAAIVASASPLGIIPMGTFSSALIAWVR
jgi:hypothetical protein